MITTAFVQEFMIGTAAAVLCGGMIGLDRQLRGRPAGLRTCIIVVLASGLFVTAGRTLVTVDGDPTRVLAAVATGVGFLGAGVIMNQDGRIQGITTAAIIWMLAAIGGIIGIGQPIVAVMATIVVMVVIGAVDIAEHHIERMRKEFNPRKDQM